MTMPHLENCRHQDSGWCLACVKKLWREKEKIQGQFDYVMADMCLDGLEEEMREKGEWNDEWDGE